MTWQPPKGFFIKINDHGKDRVVRLYSTTSDYSKDIHISDDLKTIEMVGNNQVRLTTSDNNEYILYSILNKRISYDVDLSHVPKGWLGTFYTCDFTGLKPPSYLDAQSFDSRTELDIMEGNYISWHTTQHRSGDRGGQRISGIGGTVMHNQSQKFVCDQTQKDVIELYGVDKWINTLKPFHVSCEYHPDKVRVELSQDGHIIYKEVYDEGYLSQCKLDNPCHCIVMSLWTGWVGWCDDNVPVPNNSYMNGQKKYSVSNITIQDLSVAKEVVADQQQKCCCSCHLD